MTDEEAYRLWMTLDPDQTGREFIATFARAIAADMKERCAKVCEAERDRWGAGDCHDTTERCAAAIRALGD